MNDNCEELCPSCKGELYDSDSKEVEHIVRSIKKIYSPNPVRLLAKCARNLYKIGRQIHYDFSNYPKVDGFLFCETCKCYFSKCPTCGKLVKIGNEPPVFDPLKVQCNDCLTTFLVYTHPNSNDEGSDYYMYL